MERLDGVGRLEFDEEMAKIEDAILREQVQAYNQRMKEIEEHRKQHQRQLAAFMGQHQAAIAAAAASSSKTSSTVVSENEAKSTTAKQEDEQMEDDEGQNGGQKIDITSVKNECKQVSSVSHCLGI